MPHPTHPGIRLCVIASSLLLVSGFIAYRAGYVSTDGLIARDQPNSLTNESSADPHASQPLAKNESQAAVNVRPPISGDPSVDATEAETKLQVLRAAHTQASAKLKAMEDAYAAKPKPQKVRAVMVGSKSIVLLDAKVAKQNAVHIVRIAQADEDFAKQDRNRDGKLTREELDDPTWKKCLALGVVMNDAVDAAGFAKVFLSTLESK